MNKICGVPFFRMTFHHDSYGGKNIAAVPCCGAWLKKPYDIFSIPVKEDSLSNVDVMGAWNSKEMRTFRDSILDGSYRFCKKDTCPHLVNGYFQEPPSKALPFIEKGETILNYPPEFVILGIDRACNLQCRTCRGSKEPIANEKTYNRTVSFFKSGAKMVTLNASGELFVNRYMMKVLQEFSYREYPNIECINIMTNGTCFNRVSWFSISEDAQKLIGEVSVSIDSPYKETYESIRLGGNHSIITRNMNFISELRANGAIKKLSLVCVLQKKNIHEIEDFVKYAIDLKADLLILNKVERWGHNEEEYFNKNMALPEGWGFIYKDKIDKAKKLIKEHNLGLLSNII